MACCLQVGTPVAGRAPDRQTDRLVPRDRSFRLVLHILALLHKVSIELPPPLE